jgi:hypothetical protein
MPILEDGEGPRWKFAYSNFKNDPTPDILLLGAWKHPNTRNNLVGGINLHYLNEKQRDALARILPQIMQGGDLKERYWIGRRLLPDVFNEYYRTYNSNFIRGVRKDVMFPKYGFMKTAQKWLKTKLANIFKTKAQREKDAQPEYPGDLSNMQDRLDQVVAQLQTQPPPEEPEDTPEMKVARQAFQDFQRQKTLDGIRDLEDRPMRHAQFDYEQEIGQRPGPEPEEPDVVDQQQMAQDFKKEQAENRAELEDPANEIDLGDGEIDLEESIAYYSPKLGHYVFERNTVIMG